MTVGNRTVTPHHPKMFEKQVMFYMSGNLYFVLHFHEMGLQVIWDQGMYMFSE